MSTFTFDKVSNENWERAFGKHDPEKFRKAKKEIEKEKAKQSEKADDETGPAIHGDSKMYHGYDPGLGCVVHGRSHRKALMKAKGLRECG